MSISCHNKKSLCEKCSSTTTKEVDQDHTQQQHTVNTAPPAQGYLAVCHPQCPVHVHCLLLQGELGAWDLHGAGEHSLQGQGGQGDHSIHSHIICYTSVDSCCGHVNLWWSENIRN